MYEPSTSCPQLGPFPHLVEFILTCAIRARPRPIVFASAEPIATILNAVSRTFNGGMLSPSCVAIFRMPWIDSIVAARLGDVWLLRELDNLSKLSFEASRPLVYYKSSEHAFDHAGAGGNLAVVEHMFNNNQDFGCHRIILQASIHGHLHILDWFAEHHPEELQKLPSAGFLADALPHDLTGEHHLRVLQWWIQHQDLWNPTWNLSRHDWQLRVLVHACKHQHLNVVEYWLQAQDYRLIHEDPNHLQQLMTWPLAAAAFTGKLDFFVKIHAVWPDSMSEGAFGLAGASGNLDLAKHYHSLFMAAQRDSHSADPQSGISISGMGLCYLLATASAEFAQDESKALAMLNWLYNDLRFPVTRDWCFSGRNIHLPWITGSWPIFGSVSDYPMDVATRIGSLNLLDWWRVALFKKDGRTWTSFAELHGKFYSKPLVAAAQARGIDRSLLVTWWKDLGLDPFLGGETKPSVWSELMEKQAPIQVFDWLVHCGAGKGDLPTLMIDRACGAGRIDVLDWI